MQQQPGEGAGSAPHLFPALALEPALLSAPPQLPAWTLGLLTPFFGDTLPLAGHCLSLPTAAALVPGTQALTHPTQWPLCWQGGCPLSSSVQP